MSFVELPNAVAEMARAAQAGLRRNRPGTRDPSLG